MIPFFLTFILFYALVMVGLFSKWKIVGGEYLEPRAPVSVIIPFRNESKILLKTLDNLKGLSVEEIIFCNDHSEDNSCDIIRKFIFDHHINNWKLIHNAGIGKKAAVTSGVEISSHEIIFTTDADCTLNDRGVMLMVSKFLNQDIQMVCGPVSVHEDKSYLGIYQLAEWASITLVTNYFFNINKPLMCSAANMAYRKSAFWRVGGYKNNEKISSGDDEYLLKKIAKAYGSESILYITDPTALVATLPTTDMSLYLSQRARWAGKWKAHNELSHAGTAILFFLISVVQISSIILLSGKLEYGITFLTFWLVKTGIDFLVLGHVMKTYERKISFMKMIGVSVLHPLSVIVISVFSIFVKNTWKGRVVLTKA